MSSGNRREDTRGWFGFVLNRACWIPSGAIPSVLGGHGPPYPSHPCSAGTARHIRWAARPTSNRFRRETENEGRPTSDSPKFKSSCRAMHSEVHVVKQGHMCRSSGVPPPVQGVLDETLPIRFPLILVAEQWRCRLYADVAQSVECSHTSSSFPVRHCCSKICVCHLPGTAQDSSYFVQKRARNLYRILSSKSYFWMTSQASRRSARSMSGGIEGRAR